MDGALTGIRVIDLAQHLAGPGTSMYLADQGAAVIKVEPRLTEGCWGALPRGDHEGVAVTAGVWISDCSVPMLMSYGIMLALWAREKTGVGQQVETSLLQAAVAMQSTSLVRIDQDPTPPAE